MRRLERSIYRDTHLAGIAHLAVGAGLAVATGVALRRLGPRSAATAVATFVSIAEGMLSSEADRGVSVAAHRATWAWTIPGV